jgi:RimJ/RimL family protein N-acetyltransferase
MVELPKTELSKALALFKGNRPSYLELVPHALVEGNAPGRIWVDGAAQPKVAFLWDEFYCCYLAGNPHGSECVNALAKLISNTLLSEAAAKGGLYIKLAYKPDAWEDHILHLFGGAKLTKLDYVLYTLQNPLILDWRSRIPTGYNMEHIDKSLLEQPNLRNLTFLIAEIQQCWPSVERFLANGFGFCLVRGDEVVCWCTAEYKSGSRCGAGVETIKTYQRHGFATLTAAAFVEYCASHSLEIYWDAWANNAPSIRVAEKVGFTRAADYTVYAGYLRPSSTAG